MLADCVYRYLPRPLRFFYSLCFQQRQYTPYQSDSRRLKAASKRLYNRLTDLQKEHCPLVSFDFGVATTKLTIFVPHGVKFAICPDFQGHMLTHLSYSASALSGRFLFLRFQHNETERLASFLNAHEFPFTAQKVLNCTGALALVAAPELIGKTAFTEFRKFNKHNCQREGLIFNHSLKLKQQFFHCARPDYKDDQLAPSTQKWRGQHFNRRLAVDQPLQFPCLFVDLGNTLKIYKFSPEAYEILGEYQLAGGTFLGLARVLSDLQGAASDYQAVSKAADAGNPSAVDLTVGDIYGGAYAGEGLNSDLLAACLGKFVALAENHHENSDSAETPPRNVSFSLEDTLSSLQRMIAINAAYLAARFVMLTGIKQCLFTGGFLDSRSVLENISWAFNLYCGQEAIFIQHDVVLASLGALFGDYREYQLDDNDDVVRMVEMIENDHEISVSVDVAASGSE